MPLGDEGTAEDSEGSWIKWETTGLNRHHWLWYMFDWAAEALPDPLLDILMFMKTDCKTDLFSFRSILAILKCMC